MSRVVAERDSVPNMELSRAATSCESPTMGPILQSDGDVPNVAGDEQPPPDHHVVSIEPRRLPFVLSFSNLTYSVKISRKMTFPSLLRRQHSFHAAEPPLSGENATGTKILLNEISGEARDGEILAVLGASGSGKSTLIDALANRIAKGSLKGTGDSER
ncbi:hypothetical protein HYC85_013965 [Camellia sinensis]|uniref:ABC transporter domain-containing protein n=1 Tax=Camellia sinensis TaxID=4442 RepID=A0A7J7H8C9_CAMSI|nr:hypothetical protein HYC85_013965 [Camellia sinensis]